MIMLDFYDEIDGQPLIAIFKNNGNENKEDEMIPDYLQVVREITDES